MKKSQKAWRIALAILIPVLLLVLVFLPMLMPEPLAWLPGWEIVAAGLVAVVSMAAGLALLWPLFAPNVAPKRRRRIIALVVTAQVLFGSLRAWTNMDEKKKFEYLHSPNNVNAVVFDLKRISGTRDETYGYVTRVRARFFYELAYKDKDNAVYVLSTPEERTFTWIDDYTLAITHPKWGDPKNPSPGAIVTEYIRW